MTLGRAHTSIKQTARVAVTGIISGSGRSSDQQNYTNFNRDIFNFLPARRTKRSTCYDNVSVWEAGWLGGWLGDCPSHAPVLYQNEETYLKTFSAIWKHHHSSFLRSLHRYTIPRETPSAAGVKYTEWEKIGEFRIIFDVHHRLSRKQCKIDLWLQWNVIRRSWVPDWMV